MKNLIFVITLLFCAVTAQAQTVVQMQLAEAKTSDPIKENPLGGTDYPFYSVGRLADGSIVRIFISRNIIPGTLDRNMNLFNLDFQQGIQYIAQGDLGQAIIGYNTDMNGNKVSVVATVLYALSFQRCWNCERIVGYQ